jgi:FtsH-binding integral membrane protein
VASSQGVAARTRPRVAGRNGFVDRYFYFSMSLLAAAIVVWGFSHSINQNLFHPVIPRPFLLWIHGAAFSGWVAFYIFQSVLVRTRNVNVHRLLGWFGAALAASMVGLGFTTAVVMGRFDKHILRIADADTFLGVPFGDMAMFGILVTLAIMWRKKPELHRRLLFLASCALLDAPFGRIDFIFNSSIFYVFVDLVMLLGVARDLVVDGRVHKVYRVALPVMFCLQAVIVYLWRGAPAWWVHVGQGILG